MWGWKKEKQAFGKDINLMKGKQEIIWGLRRKVLRKLVKGPSLGEDNSERSRRVR